MGPKLPDLLKVDHFDLLGVWSRRERSDIWEQIPFADNLPCWLPFFLRAAAAAVMMWDVLMALFLFARRMIFCLQMWSTPEIYKYVYKWATEVASMSMNSSFRGEFKFVANFAVNEWKQSENDQKSLVSKKYFHFSAKSKG